jgi:hypothetical protein
VKQWCWTKSYKSSKEVSKSSAFTVLSRRIVQGRYYLGVFVALILRILEVKNQLKEGLSPRSNGSRQHVARIPRNFEKALPSPCSH